MGAAEIRGAAALLLALPFAGCAANQNKAESLPPVSESVAKLPEPTPAESPVAAPTPPTVVVIDDPAAEQTAQAPQTLAEAARAEQARRATAKKPVVVLNNSSLTAYGKDQKLTVAEGSESNVSEPAAAAAAAVAAAEQNEKYWRERGLEIRQRWRSAHDRIADLQGEAEQLRTRFYSTDDPYVRDGQIKPEWDRALDELDQSRREEERCSQEIERFLLEGRRAGALPGWLREGIELEPAPPERKSPSAEPTEPVEATEAPRDPE
ncbi:MAG: hypothetical protein R2862_05140 [Thermoanaerobaculia bacterium]